MDDVAAQLKMALSRCVVQLSGAGCQGGSGFFVAPGYVLTCAHVVLGASSVSVTWQDHDSERTVHRAGTVRYCQPDPVTAAESILDYPDLAIIELASSPDQPCVWLWIGDIAPEKDVQLHDDSPLYAYGYNTVYSKQALGGAGMMLTASGPQRFGNGTFVRVTGDELPPGSSGSPIIDLTTGRVMAMVKTTRETNTDRGGLAVPLTAFRRVPRELQVAIRDGHDSYHASGDCAWPVLVDQLRAEQPGAPARVDLRYPINPLSRRVSCQPPKLSAQDEAELMGLLANLAPADNVVALFRAAAPDFRAPDWELLDRRDVIQLLNDGMAAFRRELPALLVFIELAANELPGQRATALRAWNERFARKGRWYAQLDTWRSTPRQHASDEPPSVIACISPNNNPSKNLGGHDSNNCFNLDLLLYHSPDKIEPVYEQKGPFTLDELWQHLAETLPGALHELDRRELRQLGNRKSPLIELVVPLELLDTAVDQWPFSSRRRSTRLGRMYPIVVRAPDDEEVPDIVRRRIEEHWTALSGRSVGAHLRWLHCEKEHDEDALDKWVWRLPVEKAVLGLPGPAGETKHGAALDTALFAGVPVAIFRRIPCDRHGETGPSDSVDNGGGEGDEECSGYRFSQVLTARLDGVTVEQLPYTIRELRSDDDHYLHGVMLLWQNPARYVPIGPCIFPQ